MNNPPQQSFKPSSSNQKSGAKPKAPAARNQEAEQIADDRQKGHTVSTLYTDHTMQIKERTYSDRMLYNNKVGQRVDNVSKESLVPEDTEYQKLARRGGSRMGLLSQENMRTRDEERSDYNLRMERLKTSLHPDRRGRPAPFSTINNENPNNYIERSRTDLRPVPGVVVDDRFGRQPVTVSASQERERIIAQSRAITPPYAVIDNLQVYQRDAENPAKKRSLEDRLKGRQ